MCDGFSIAYFDAIVGFGVTLLALLVQASKLFHVASERPMFVTCDSSFD